MDDQLKAQMIDLLELIDFQLKNIQKSQHLQELKVTAYDLPERKDYDFLIETKTQDFDCLPQVVRCR